MKDWDQRSSPGDQSFNPETWRFSNFVSTPDKKRAMSLIDQWRVAEQSGNTGIMQEIFTELTELQGTTITRKNLSVMDAARGFQYQKAQRATFENFEAHSSQATYSSEYYSPKIPLLMRWEIKIGCPVVVGLAAIASVVYAVMVLTK